MAPYSPDHPLSEVIYAHPEILPVINRLGIYLGVGDDSIETICRNADVDSWFFVTILNTYLEPDDSPVVQRSDLNLDRLVDYLEATDRQYAGALLPNIERHFDSLIAHAHSQDSNLQALRHFFNEMKNELSTCIAFDLQQVLPMLRHAHKRGSLPALGSLYAPWQAVEDKMDDLTSFFVRHLRGGCDPNLCVAVVSAVMTLRRDISRNNRIRRSLLPLTHQARPATASNDDKHATDC